MGSVLKLNAHHSDQFQCILPTENGNTFQDEYFPDTEPLIGIQIYDIMIAPLA